MAAVNANINVNLDVNKLFNQIKGVINQIKKKNIEKTIAQCKKDIYANLDFFRNLLHDPKIKTEAVNSKYIQTKLKSVKTESMKTINSLPDTYRGIKKGNKDYFDTLSLALFKIDNLIDLSRKKTVKNIRTAVRVKYIIKTLIKLTPTRRKD